MAFKMNGSQLYGKLKLNRSMDDSSQPDGRAKSSAMQLRPSYINGEMVSDNAADLEDEKNVAKNLEQIKGEQTKVTRKGQSEVKKIKKDAKKRNPGKKEKDALDTMDKDMIKKEEAWTKKPENRDEQVKSWKLNNPGYKLVNGKKVKK